MIVIVGAGLAGLAAARRLVQSGFDDFVVLERSGRVGGRVETRTVDGFRLDSGFHVASTGYPSYRRFLPVTVLEPAWFDSGVLLQEPSGGLVPVYHPFRHPKMARAAGWPPLPWPDLLRFALLATEALARPGEAWSKVHQESTAHLLNRRRFSSATTDSLFRPFFGGVFLDEELQTSAGLLRYYLRNFILGRAFLPAGGIGRLALTLRRDVPEERIRLNTTVREVQQGPDGVRLALESGEILTASRVVLATDPVATSRLLGWPEPMMRPTTTIYFRSRQALYPERCLILPHAVHPLVRHFVQLTNIDPCLAPSGEHLLSATVLDDRGLSDTALYQLAIEEINGLIPGAAGLLHPLHVVRIPNALPVQSPQNLTKWMQRRENLSPGIFLAGDMAGNASQQNAMGSGIQCADAARGVRGN